jgi:inhibitor of KinA
MQEFHPLGDSAALVYLTDEAAATQFATAAWASQNADWLDVVQAYSSVAVFFDPDRTDLHSTIEAMLRLTIKPEQHASQACRIIPCCYELGPDLEFVAHHVGISTDEVVRLHGCVDYTVYAIGFCPGFPYLGYLPAKLSGIPRMPSPRLRVEAGSVGLTGRQTGIYPLDRPGGWRLIGQTPLQLVDLADGYFPLKAGDKVKFQPIDRKQFESLRGRRLIERDL